VSSKCGELLDQMETWNAKERQAVLEDDYGLCYSLANVMSRLKSFLRSEWQAPVNKEYNNDKSSYGGGKLTNPIAYW